MPVSPLAYSSSSFFFALGFLIRFSSVCGVFVYLFSFPFFFSLQRFFSPPPPFYFCTLTIPSIRFHDIKTPGTGFCCLNTFFLFCFLLHFFCDSAFETGVSTAAFRSRVTFYHVSSFVFFFFVLCFHRIEILQKSISIHCCGFCLLICHKRTHFSSTKCYRFVSMCSRVWFLLCALVFHLVFAFWNMAHGSTLFN